MKIKSSCYYFLLGCLLIFILCPIFSVSYATPRIAVLAFELNDVSALPNTPEEIIRTASIKPLLDKALIRYGDTNLIQIDTKIQNAANSSFGNLFNFPEEAVKLGKRYRADWLIVSQHSKPSFLFSYLVAQVININTAKPTVKFTIELKGSHAKVLQHGVNTLAKKIHEIINTPSTTE